MRTTSAIGRMFVVAVSVGMTLETGWCAETLQANLPASPQLRAADIGQTTMLRPSLVSDNFKAMAPRELAAGAGLQMVAPRGGCASALAVVRGQRLENLAAAVSELRGPGGAIPSASIQVRWLTGQAFADTFSAAPVENEVQPIVVTVQVPSNAVPGVYSGKLNVTGTGLAGALDVKLDVSAWRLPVPKDWPLLVGLVHTPDTIALQYNVEPWSDQHLKFLEPSLRLLRDLGSESCYMFLMAEGMIYERHSIVRWRNNTPDFTCMDKYLDLWQKVCGQPKKMTLHVWEGNRKAHLNAGNSVKVTRIGAGGNLESFMAPYYDTPQAMAFWKPVYDGIRERLAKRGWKDTEVLLGVPWDCHPSEEAIEFFKKATPGWRWRVFTHGFNIPLPQADGRMMLPCGAEIGWLEGTGPIGFGQLGGKFPSLIKSADMKRVYPFTIACRGQVAPSAHFWMWRDAPASSVRGGLQGISQVGLDSWTMNFEGKVRPPGLGASELIQIGDGGFNPRGALAKSITVPGPNGAEPKLQYELLREGLQAAAAFVLARHTPAGEDFEKFMQKRLENAYAVSAQGKLIDRAPDTYVYQLYSPSDLTVRLAEQRKAYPGRRLVVLARSHEKDADSCRNTGAAAGAADAVVVVNDETGTAGNIRAGVPKAIPSETAQDVKQAIQKARTLAGSNGVVVASVDRFFNNAAFPVLVEERGQDKWNAAVKALYDAAGSLKQ